MRDIASKTDGVSTLAAAEFNGSIMGELEKAVTYSGLTLDAAAGPDTDTEMLAQAVTRTAQGAMMYQDSGSANAYVLSAIGGFKQPEDYFDGMTVIFQVGNTNTGASTVNLGALGLKDIVDRAGSALTGGELTANDYVMIQYDLSNDYVILLGKLYFSSGVGELPIGSIYINSSDSTNPATLLGYGTWVAIQDRMLIGAGGSYSAGATGGSATTTQTTSTMVSHNHQVSSTGSVYDDGMSGTAYIHGSDPNNARTSPYTASSGSGGAMTTISPYYGAYIWRRTA